ncbi:MAG TPA: PqqD family protein [Firmicutes bacterium]|nr:PqqD family protein [Bacillota bacterium]
MTPENIAIDKQFVLRQDVLVDQIGDECVVFDPTTKMVFTVNQTGAMIINKLRQPQLIATLVEYLASCSSASRDVILRDCEAFLAILLDKGLATCVE